MELRRKGPDFGLPPGRALHNFALLNIIMDYWSNGVLEKRKPNTDFCNLEQKQSRFSDA